MTVTIVLYSLSNKCQTQQTLPARYTCPFSTAIHPKGSGPKKKQRIVFTEPFYPELELIWDTLRAPLWNVGRVTTLLLSPSSPFSYSLLQAENI
jgi:hypothetical protein